MKICRKDADISIAGIGHVSTKVHLKFQTTLKSRVSEYVKKVELYVLPKVTVDLPSIPVDVSSWSLPTGIYLADPGFYQTAPIDVVLGGELFFEIFNVHGRISLGESLPTLVNSAFGWVVSGKIAGDQGCSSTICNVAAVTYNCERYTKSNHYLHGKSRIFRRRHQGPLFEGSR